MKTKLTWQQDPFLLTNCIKTCIKQIELPRIHSISHKRKDSVPLFSRFKANCILVQVMSRWQSVFQGNAAAQWCTNPTWQNHVFSSLQMGLEHVECWFTIRISEEQRWTPAEEWEKKPVCVCGSPDRLDGVALLPLLPLTASRYFIFSLNAGFTRPLSQPGLRSPGT